MKKITSRSEVPGRSTSRSEVRDKAGASGGRRPPQELGRDAESAVAEYLRAQGASIIDANVRSGHYEIDLIATKGDLVLIVEVRTRGAGSFANALESIDWKKRKRIVSAAQSLWRSRLSKLPGIDRLRFDAASVTFEENGEARVDYVAGAFTA